MRVLLGGDPSAVAGGMRVLSVNALAAGNFLGPCVLSGEQADTQIAEVRRKRIVRMKRPQSVYFASTIPPVTDALRAAVITLAVGYRMRHHQMPISTDHAFLSIFQTNIQFIARGVYFQECVCPKLCET